MRQFRYFNGILALLCLLGLSPASQAHKASDSFLYLDLDAAEIRIDVALRDLALLVPLDANNDQQVTGQELRAQRAATTQVIENALTLTSERIIYTYGLFHRSTNEMRHDDVLNMKMEQNFLERILHFGDMALSSAGDNGMEIAIHDVPRPQEMAEFIRQRQ
jgi:hypothetical protein